MGVDLKKVSYSGPIAGVSTVSQDKCYEVTGGYGETSYDDNI